MYVKYLDTIKWVQKLFCTTNIQKVNKMTGKTKIILGAVALVGIGVTYYLLTRKKDKCADFIVDGFTYNLDKSQGYAKKKGDWAGCGIVNSPDPLYYTAVNTVGTPILLKKSDVAVRNEVK